MDKEMIMNDQLAIATIRWRDQYGAWWKLCERCAQAVGAGDEAEALPESEYAPCERCHS